MKKMVLWAVLALVIGLGAYIRLAPSDPAQWNVAPVAPVDQDLPGGVVRVVETGPDGLQRLDNFQRGPLNGTRDAITTLAFEQDWSLGPVANWTSFTQDNNGDGTDNLVQTRTNNTANEITGITNTTGGAWGSPTYDAVGNTTAAIGNVSSIATIAALPLTEFIMPTTSRLPSSCRNRP